MQVKRAFIDVNGDFAVFREKNGRKRWFYAKIVNDNLKTTEFKPKSSQWKYNFLNGCGRLHIHNRWLYHGNYPVKAIKIVGSNIDLDTIYSIMKQQQQRMKDRIKNFREELHYDE